jgi:hypothetical protein
LQARDRMLDAGGQLSGIRLMRLVELQQLLQDLFGPSGIIVGRVVGRRSRRRWPS